MALSNSTNTYTFDQSDVSDVEDIPLPNQVPPPPTVSFDKERSLGTFDSVLSQNQDLMSRLTIALRHNLDLEKQVGQYIERNRYLELQAQALHSEMSQISIVNKNLEIEFYSIREQRDSAEKMYAEFHTEAMNRIEKMANQLIRLRSYRRKIRTRVRPAIDNLNKTMQKEREEFAGALEQNMEMRGQLEQFKKQLTEAYARIQNQHTEHEGQKKLLVETYEEKLNFYIKELDFYKTEHEKFQKSHIELDKKNLALVESQALFENRAIVSERRYEGLKAQSDQTIHELREMVAQMKSENTALRANLENANQEIAERGNEISMLKDDVIGIRDQYEGLQILWEKSSQEAEESQLKFASLQKLNRDLSQALNERRRENEFMQEQVRQIQNKSSENINSVYEHIKAFTKDKARLKDSNFVEPDSSSQEIISRIEAIVKEAQSGPAGKLDL